eukprot:Phypoly_transcript_18781.p1 GENE.Phypoly_transcript_18781~~Phypoly_transcript_18781.p1  ORF type:complete len:222 (+),score=36.53 Phypoly_transcript_18781:56-721(+)
MSHENKPKASEKHCLIASSFLLALKPSSGDAQRATDVISSLLLAVLGARKRAPPITSPQDFETAILTICSGLGWTNSEFGHLQSTSTYATISKALLAFVKDEQTSVEEIISAFSKLPTSNPCVKSFTDTTVDFVTHQGTFLVGVADLSATNPIVTMYIFSFSTTATHDPDSKTLYMEQPIDKEETKVVLAHTTMVLNEEVYAKTRDAVALKLLNHYDVVPF